MLNDLVNEEIDISCFIASLCTILWSIPRLSGSDKIFFEDH